MPKLGTMETTVNLTNPVYTKAPSYSGLFTFYKAKDQPADEAGFQPAKAYTRLLWLRISSLP